MMYLVDIRDKAKLAIEAINNGNLDGARECLAFINEYAKILDQEQSALPLLVTDPAPERTAETILRETTEFFCDEITKQDQWVDFK